MRWIRKLRLLMMVMIVLAERFQDKQHITGLLCTGQQKCEDHNNRKEVVMLLIGVYFGKENNIKLKHNRCGGKFPSPAAGIHALIKECKLHTSN